MKHIEMADISECAEFRRDPNKNPDLTDLSAFSEKSGRESCNHHACKAKL